MTRKRISINRAPVLTLWAAVVAERLGYDRGFALTLGKAVAGLNAQSKGQRLGIFGKPKDKPLKIRRKAEVPKKVTLMGRTIPVVRTTHGVRAVVNDEPIDPQSVQKYLEQKFGEDLADVTAVMVTVAKSFRAETLAEQAYRLYEKFRPTVPEGVKGWGTKGELDLATIKDVH
ncbi:MAG TPA: hypothetical protein VMM37_03410 [Bacteroidota bacterium]|nr:hypothetical protein [Bacteroidota bacterium]